MQKILFIILFPMISFGQNVNIPDANFKNYLVNNFAINTNGDSEIQVSEASAFTGLINCIFLGISDLTGIEAFTTIQGLEISYNQLTSLDVSNNTSLITLYCDANQLTSLDVSNNTALTNLTCSFNNLLDLDLSNNLQLSSLAVQGTNLSQLDITQNVDLTYLDCS